MPEISVWPGVDIGVHAERGIFLRQLGEGGAHFFLVRFGFRLDGHRNHRRREIDRLEHDGLVFIAQRVAGSHVLQAHAGGNIARFHRIDFLALVRMHPQQAPDALARFLGGVVNVLPGLQHAGIHANIGHVADERIGHDLERQRGKRLIVRRTPQFRLFGIRIDAFDRGNIERRRQIIDHRIEQRLNALVLERRARHHRHQLERNRRPAQRRAQLRRLQLVLVEILGQDGVVVLGDILDDLVAMLFIKFRGQRRSLHGGLQFRVRLQVLRIPQLFERQRFVLRAQGFALPDDGALFDEIDDADEIVLAPDGILDRHGMPRKPLPHGLDRMIEIGAHAVHLIDERNARHAILVRLAPYGFRLRLHAGHRVEHGHRAIQHAQRPLHFHGEIHVARRINNIDAVLHSEPAPGGRRRGGGDGDAALALLLHPVHGGGAFVHFADLVGHTRIEQDALGAGGFPRIDVRHDPDVPDVLELDLACHSERFVRATSDNARRLCWPPPCGARPPSSSLLRRGRWPRP